MEDWCKWCVYADKNGADDPCFECESDNDGAPTRFAAKRKKQTNADKYFRNATDEELAMLLQPTCPPCDECPSVGGIKDCYKCWLNWLKQEAEESEN